MKVPQTPADEAARVEAVKEMKILSTPREADLDRLTQTAKSVFKTDISVISIVDGERQWFKSRQGIRETETPREVSFCGHAIHGDDVMVVENAERDARFFDNPLVTGGPTIRFYAGQPVKSPDGYAIGTICVIDSKPRSFSEEDRINLRNLGRMVEIVLENRKFSETQQALLESLVAARRDKLLDPLTGIWNRRGLEEMFDRESSRCERLGLSIAGLMIDIDDFKSINDRFGHAVGDEVLSLTASILVSVCRGADVVARIGGDEFAVIIPDTDLSSVDLVCEKLDREIRGSVGVPIAAGACTFTASIGSAFRATTPRDGVTLSAILKEADKAMFRAKTTNKSSNPGADR